MNDHELKGLLADLESDRVERKESLSDPGRIREAICAFANDLPNHRRPGVIVIGVRDDGSCADRQVTDELLRTLAAMRDHGNILPLPSMVVQKRVLDGCQTAIVLVQPSDAPPVRFGFGLVRAAPRPRRMRNGD